MSQRWMIAATVSVIFFLMSATVSVTALIIAWNRLQFAASGHHASEILPYVKVGTLSMGCSVLFAIVALAIIFRQYKISWRV